jgi:hypothetical protein
MLTMPADANIPSWAKDLGDVLEMDFPSWSKQGGSYQIIMDKQTRELRCNCQAANFGKPCHHLGYLLGMVKKPLHPQSMGVQPTSMEAFKQALPTISEHQAIVLGYIAEHGPVSNYQIAEGLGWKINGVTPRNLELRIKEKVKFAGTRTNPVTGRREMTWKAV